MNKLFVVGYSGHAYVVAEAAQEAGNVVVAYTSPKEADQNPFDLIYLGDEGNELQKEALDYRAILGIGSNAIRKKAFLNLKDRGIKIESVVHPSSQLSSIISLGEGTFVSASAVVNIHASIGKACIINTGAIVEHECEIGDYTHIAPGAVLAGNVKVGDSTFVGANSVVKEGVSIGNNVTIGAGTVVIKDIPDGSKVVGNPARFL